VVDLGGVGSYTLTITGKNAVGATVTMTQSFQDIAGPATQIVLGAPVISSDDSTTPPKPTGW
jgi:hypothetical protein